MLFHTWEYTHIRNALDDHHECSIAFNPSDSNPGRNALRYPDFIKEPKSDHGIRIWDFSALLVLFLLSCSTLALLCLSSSTSVPEV